MNELQIFNSEKFGRSRAVERGSEPWFCLADVCKPLDLRVSDCRKRLKPEGVDTINTLTAGGVQGMLYVNEGNLYRAIFQSKKPEAEEFTAWVTEEVLPALRKHGTYTVPARLAPEVSPNAIANLIRVTRRVMLDMGSTPQEVGAMARDVFVTWNIPVPVSLNRQIPGQMCLPGMDGAKGLTA